MLHLPPLKGPDGDALIKPSGSQAPSFGGDAGKALPFRLYGDESGFRRNGAS